MQVQVSASPDGQDSGAEIPDAGELASLPAEVQSLPRCAASSWGKELGADLEDSEQSSEPPLRDLLLLRLTSSEDSLLSQLPWLSYTAYVDGALRYQRQLTLSYRRSEPNGKGCGFVNDAEVTTPP